MEDKIMSVTTYHETFFVKLANKYLPIVEMSDNNVIGTDGKPVREYWNILPNKGVLLSKRELMNGITDVYLSRVSADTTPGEYYGFKIRNKFATERSLINFIKHGIETALTLEEYVNIGLNFNAVMSFAHNETKQFSTEQELIEICKDKPLVSCSMEGMTSDKRAYIMGIKDFVSHRKPRKGTSAILVKTYGVLSGFEKGKPVFKPEKYNDMNEIDTEGLPFFDVKANLLVFFIKHFGMNISSMNCVNVQ